MFTQPTPSPFTSAASAQSDGSSNAPLSEWTPVAPRQNDEAIGAMALAHLRGVIAMDSASDERSDTIPSTRGQVALAQHVGDLFATAGLVVEIDDYANVIGTLAGRGRGATQAPIAFMVHLDTARGTNATDDLTVVPNWGGAALTYSQNPGLSVSVANYPSLSQFVGHDVVHGPGDAPIGLDDKLGLTHLLTLADLLHDNPAIEHPPLLLIGRPDEEIGRMAAIEGLATMLAARGVAFGYTVDGILPFEVNVENFNAAAAQVVFSARPVVLTHAAALTLTIGGVNTHGCTAKAEGHRPATRLATEVLAAARADGLNVSVVGFVSDTLRDCDGVLHLEVADDDVAARLAAIAEQILAPHRPRGASLMVALAPVHDDATRQEAAAGLAGATADALSYITDFLASEGVSPIAAEASEGREGYSQPYRVLPDNNGGVVIDVRLRDFDTDGLTARRAHVIAVAAATTCSPQVTLSEQYVNMAPRLADRPELVRWPVAAAAALGEHAERLPIRGGTGVDPFLDAGVPIANLGTGYFAPESEKELTSVQYMVSHARWLLALVQRISDARLTAEA